MNQAPYPFARNANQYIFVSTGRVEIIKMVEFTPMQNQLIFNLCFGDAAPEGEIDDFANSNNGDMRKVLATVIHITADFLLRNPKATIYSRKYKHTD